MGLLFCRYTLFAQSELSGEAIMKPLWFDFPSEVESFDIQDEHLVGKCSCQTVHVSSLRCHEVLLVYSLVSGSALLVYPVVEAGLSGVTVYFPGDQVCHSTNNQRYVLVCAEKKINLFYVTVKCLKNA